MSEAELLFNFFSLLLGFVLVEVLSGLMRTLRARLPSAPGAEVSIRVGWLTPMLGAYAMLNVLMCWITVWVYLDRIPVGYDTLTTGLVLIAFYYFAASMIYPDKPRDWPDLDAWFWLHRRQVLGSIFTASIPFWLPDYFVANLTRSELIVSSVVVSWQAFFLLVAILGQGYRTVWTALAMLIAAHLSFIPLEVLHRNGFW